MNGLKILVIFTGGTIGSAADNGWISPDASAQSMLLSGYGGVELDTLAPYTILSENLSASEINLLAASVRENIGKYDGIIVTHGTDTLQYTAAALSFTVDCADTPVVLVSANYPLADARSNGSANFEAAVALIGAKTGGGVYVSYRNQGCGKTNIHWGARVLGHTETMDELYSLDNQLYAVYTDGKIVLNPKLSKPEATVCNSKLCAEPKILLINSRPGDGFDYDAEKYNAVLFAPYHSGTLNTASKGLAKLCKCAQTHGIPLLLAGLRGGDCYESTRAYEKLGITALPFCGLVQAYMKIWLAVSRGEDIIDFAKKPLCGEFI